MRPVNREAWELYCAVSTQWRSAGYGRTGLDYGAVFVVAEVMGLEMSENMLDKIQTLEREELKRDREEIDRMEREARRG